MKTKWGSSYIKLLSWHSLQPIEEFHGIYHTHSGDSLVLAMFSMNNCVTGYILKEDLQDTTRLFVGESRNALYTTTTSETADCGLGDALGVFTKDLSETAGSSLTEAFTLLAATRHFV